MSAGAGRGGPAPPGRAGSSSLRAVPVPNPALPRWPGSACLGFGLERGLVDPSAEAPSAPRRGSGRGESEELRGRLPASSQRLRADGE